MKAIITTISDIHDTPEHWSKDLTMYITKNNQTIILKEDEIVELVKRLPRTFGGTY